MTAINAFVWASLLLPRCSFLGTRRVSVPGLKDDMSFVTDFMNGFPMEEFTKKICADFGENWRNLNGARAMYLQMVERCWKKRLEYLAADENGASGSDAGTPTKRLGISSDDDEQPIPNMRRLLPDHHDRPPPIKMRRCATSIALLGDRCP